MCRNIWTIVTKKIKAARETNCLKCSDNLKEVGWEPSADPVQLRRNDNYVQDKIVSDIKAD